MSRTTVRIFLNVWMLVAVATTQAEEIVSLDDTLALRHLASADGLPAGTISGLAFDQHGWLWLATDSGLWRFDGRTFRADDTLQSTFPTATIAALAAGKDGLLVGTSDHGLLRIAGRDVQPISRPSALGADWPVHSIKVDRDNVAWVATPDELWRLPSGTTSLRSTLPNTKVTELIEDRHGTMWALTGVGVFRKLTSSFDSFALPAALAKGARSLALDERGELWLIDALGLAHRLRGDFGEGGLAIEIERAGFELKDLDGVLATDGLGLLAFSREGVYRRPLEAGALVFERLPLTLPIKRHLVTPAGVFFAGAGQLTQLFDRRRKSPPPTVYVLGVRTERRDLKVADYFQLESGEKDLKLELAVVELLPAAAAPALLYRLGDDSDWRASAPELHLTDLPFGITPLLLKAQDAQGQSGPMLALKVVRRMPFWRRFAPVFVFGVVLAIALLIVARRRARVPDEQP
jgi:hypothetical protein